MEFPALGTAVIETGGKQAPVLAACLVTSKDKLPQDTSPAANPLRKLWFAATVASTALPATPGAIPIPPTVPKRPPRNVFT